MKTLNAKFIAALIVLGILAALVFISKTASAQTTQAGSSSQSGAIAAAQSGAVGYGLGGSGSGVGVGGSSNANNNISFDNHSIGSDLGDQVPTMFIPNLTTSNGTCMGSFSSGITVSGFGGGLGKTYTSEECNARFNANQMNAMGAPNLAIEIMCAIDSVYEADARMYKRTGVKPRCAQRPEDPSTQPVATLDMQWFKKDPVTGAYTTIETDEVSMLVAPTNFLGER